MVLRITKAALARVYHTTNIAKPPFSEFGLSFHYKPTHVDYGAGAPAGDAVFKDPDCRYLEFIDPVTKERKIGLKIWADSSLMASTYVYNTPTSVVRWFDAKTNTTKFVTVNRLSHTGEYEIDPVSGLPLNPMGRTGVTGPGKCGRFGPNHAVDPIVGYRRGAVFYFVAVRRKDTGEAAFPGGMVDPGECATATLKREFAEEAGANGVSDELNACFDTAVEVYRGPVDDPRNTDNAWLETIAKFIDVSEMMAKCPEKLQLASGSDAADVFWAEATLDIKGNLEVYVRGQKVELYASHAEILLKALPLFKLMK